MVYVQLSICVTGSMETRSRMKAAQLLGITLEGSDSEWDSKLVLKNRSQNKAEQILGISLIDGDVDYVKQQPFRRARSQVFKAVGVTARDSLTLVTRVLNVCSIFHETLHLYFIPGDFLACFRR